MDDTLPWTFLDFSQFVSFPHAKRDGSVIIETIPPAIRNPHVILAMCRISRAQFGAGSGAVKVAGFSHILHQRPFCSSEILLVGG